MVTMNNCIICGDQVTVTIPPVEIVTCHKDMCIHVVEQNIGFNYSVGAGPTAYMNCMYFEANKARCWHSAQTKINVSPSDTCGLFAKS